MYKDLEKTMLEISNMIANAYLIKHSFSIFGYKVLLCKKPCAKYKVLVKDKNGDTMPLKLLFDFTKIEQLIDDVKHSWSK